MVIDLPFKGKWIASGAGATGLTNHHDRIKSQKYAIDIVKFGEDNKLFKNNGLANEDSYTFGAEILSPVNGKVVHVTDSLPDKKSPTETSLPEIILSSGLATVFT